MKKENNATICFTTREFFQLDIDYLLNNTVGDKTLEEHLIFSNPLAKNVYVYDDFKDLLQNYSEWSVERNVIFLTSINERVFVLVM